MITTTVGASRMLATYPKVGPVCMTNPTTSDTAKTTVSSVAATDAQKPTLDTRATSILSSSRATYVDMM
jgi:hypothetical protein